MRRTHCRYCEKEIAQSDRGRPREFCDDECRRCYHGLSPCEQCGEPSWGHLCNKCSRNLAALTKAQTAANLWNEILDLRREGLLNYEIATQLRRSTIAVSSTVYRMKQAGIEVPESTYVRSGWMNSFYNARAASGQINVDNY